MKTVMRGGVLAGALLSAACASGGGGADQMPIDPNAPIACIAIDNRRGGGTLERIYLVEAPRREGGSIAGGFATATRPGEGVRAGDATVGRVTRWCTQNVSLPGRYFLRIERTSADNLDPANGQDPSQVAGWGGGARTDMVRETADFVLEPGDLWTWEVKQDRWDCRPGGATGGDC